jgi:hypothetical protein
VKRARVTIKFQNLYLNVVAHMKEFIWILQSSPRHIGNVQQTVYATEIDKCTVISKVLDLTFNNNVFLDL